MDLTARPESAASHQMYVPAHSRVMSQTLVRACLWSMLTGASIAVICAILLCWFHSGFASWQIALLGICVLELAASVLVVAVLCGISDWTRRNAADEEDLLLNVTPPR